MKILRYFLLSMLLPLSLMAASLDLGNSVFFSDEGPINVAADAGVAVRNLDSPYVMFVLYLSADADISANINRKDVVLVYKDKEYRMPSLAEFRKSYKSDSRDIEMYNRLGKEPLALSDMRFFRFNVFNDFFPDRSSGKIPAENGFVGSFYGFKSHVYFKNPGFEPGEKVLIKVSDAKDPGVWGAVAVELH